MVFDLIEEFRQFIVDRTVIAMCNRREPMNTDKTGLLTEKTRKLLARNVQERLGSHTQWRGKRWKSESIVFSQARRLIQHVQGEAKYRPFVGRF